MLWPSARGSWRPQNGLNNDGCCWSAFFALGTWSTLDFLNGAPLPVHLLKVFLSSSGSTVCRLSQLCGYPSSPGGFSDFKLFIPLATSLSEKCFPFCTQSHTVSKLHFFDKNVLHLLHLVPRSLISRMHLFASFPFYVEVTSAHLVIHSRPDPLFDFGL